MKEKKIEGFRLFNSKYNFLMDNYIYTCIIKNCDYSMNFDMPKFKNLSQEEKVRASYQRDYTFERHLIEKHGLDSLFKYDYDNFKPLKFDVPLSMLEEEEQEED